MVLSYIIYRVIAWIEVGHSYKDALTAKTESTAEEGGETEI